MKAPRKAPPARTVPVEKAGRTADAASTLVRKPPSTVPAVTGLSICALAVALLYAPILHFEFVGFDDTAYVMRNAWVRSGLTWEGIVAAFSTGGGIYWHPLTWLSHMLDISLFGLDPGAHHMQNVFWHISAAGMLFAVARRFGMSLWAATACALLWALHPLRVESVAWVAGRKDVLSGFFWLLCVWLYAGYATTPTRSRYAWMLAAGAMGYLAKPTMVTLPFVLLLLDVWPLKRPIGWVRRLAEKAPLFVLSIAVSWITVIAQQGAGALAMTRNAGVLERMEIALVAYGWYLRKIIWPTDLAVIYPYPKELSPMLWVSSALVLTLLTAAAFWQRRERPALLVGWLCFLGILVPMIGLVQAGPQPYADRFTYIASLPLTLALVYAVAPPTRSTGPRTRRTLDWGIGGATILVIAALAFLSHQQIITWRDGETLFAHAYENYEANPVAAMNLGAIYMAKGRYTEALEPLRVAVREEPGSAIHRFNLGVSLVALGQIQEADQHLRRATSLDSGRAEAWVALGSAQKALGRNREAVLSLERGLRLGIDSSREPSVRNDLAVLYATAGRFSEAERQLREALSASPGDERSRMNLAVTLLRTGRREEAVAEARRVLAANPANKQAQAMLQSIDK